MRKKRRPAKNPDTTPDSPGRRRKNIAPGSPGAAKSSRRKWLLMGLGGLAACGLAGGALWANRSMFQSSPDPEMQTNPVTEYGYEVVNRFPHDPRAFTQGLVFSDGYIYEGTGQEGQSQVRKVELETGRVVESVNIPPDQFGEGITLWNDTIVQLTWESRVAYVYDKRTFRPIRQFGYPGEGWGLTHDGTRLMMSDGTNQIRFLNPNTFAEVRPRLSVRREGQPVDELNELEFINGEIYANVWRRNYIVRISPQTGSVVAVLNLTGLRPASAGTDPENCLNGIAHDSQNGRLFVTGKRWPTLFEIRQVAMNT